MRRHGVERFHHVLDQVQHLVLGLHSARAAAGACPARDTRSHLAETEPQDGRVPRRRHERPSGPMFACIIDMSYLLWARGIDIRMLKESQIEDGRIRIKPTKTQKTSGKAVDIVVTPEIAEVIARARGLKIKYGLISQFVFPTQKGGAYTRSGLSSMWDRAKERIGMKDDVVFRDIRALAATDAARRGENRSDIEKRLVHTSGKTTDLHQRGNRGCFRDSNGATMARLNGT